jgi:UDP-N-acetylmuramoyl-tripeptide--D-alanyl-D-alanine ligase
MEPQRYGDVDWCLDCYNASPESTRMAISFLREVPHAGRRLLVLGELGELGEHAAAIHADLGRRAAALPIVLFVGAGTRAALEANRQAALPSASADWAESAEDAAEWLRPRLRAGDLVLLKGSRRVGLERILPALYPGEAGRATGAGEPGAAEAPGDVPRKEA